MTISTVEAHAQAHAGEITGTGIQDRCKRAQLLYQFKFEHYELPKSEGKTYTELGENGKFGDILLQMHKTRKLGLLTTPTVSVWVYASHPWSLDLGFSHTVGVNKGKMRIR